jgi:pimeloyl-ACP methyl ester carboxylesterase
MIEQIRRDYDDPTLKVNVIAHSMGGLITRYDLRYGTVDALVGDGAFPINMSGAGKVNTAVLLGTPNLGSVSSLQSILLGHRVGLRRIEPEVLATMPSVYELLPHPLTDWSGDSSDKDLDLDLYDVTTWKRMQWSVFDPTVIGGLRETARLPSRLSWRAKHSIRSHHVTTRFSSRSLMPSFSARTTSDLQAISIFRTTCCPCFSSGSAHGARRGPKR